MITVLAPYNHSEITAAAIRLAEHVLASGLAFKYIATSTPRTGVHPKWDKRVVWRSRTNAVLRAANTSSTIVHFGYSPTLLDEATLFGTNEKRVKQVLVPLWHQSYRGGSDRMMRFDQIVCTSRSHKQSLEKHLGYGKPKHNSIVTWCTWDSGKLAVRRTKDVDAGRVRALIYCDAGAVDYCGASIVSMFSYLLMRQPKLDVTLVHTKSWNKCDKKLLQLTQRTIPAKRLSVVRLSSFNTLSTLLSTHDWAVLPGVRSSFGLAAATALACGTPVICNDINPFHEIVTEHNGVLVPCAVAETRTKAPVAVPQSAAWHTVCCNTLLTSDKLVELRNNDWKADELRTAFNRVWDRVLVA